MPEPHSKGHLNPGAAGVAFDRFELGPGLGELVRHVWVAHWNLPDGVELPQRVLAYPAVNVVIEPQRAVLAGPDPRLSVQRLTGTSWAVGVLFRPAAAVLLSADPPAVAVGRQLPFEGGPRQDVRTLMTDAPAESARQGLVDVLRRWLLPLAAGVDERGRLVNEVCRRAEEDATILRAAELAELAGVSLRTLERLLRERVGVGPKWLIECRRLQEAATRLHAHPETSLSDLAAELGYTDYPHFSRRYAAVLGETPENTRRSGRPTP
ncbi:helix-turn-helix domain-containing protein [Herbiconiux sp. CPCC 205716]|uniref:Helix-turn-helix domain-containing protein n=1 Tax=Herbiconiux gentiana TaxID=2970912 RepID=A0ABT2GCP2_9MICO|nr:helix-turn-helix domain-containing protein [Herbiconiux gentiana]MCS5713983.1 helix-turn-helix domain-containing protein [Herbiconiux gentiana]